MFSKEKREKIVELAKECYAEGIGRDDFIKRCETIGFHGIKEQELAQELANIWSDVLIAVENEKLGNVVKSIFAVLSENEIFTHFKTREDSVKYTNELVAKVIEVLTDSNLKQVDAINAVNSALGQIKLISDEISKTLNIHTDKAFKALSGKDSEDMTLQEIADIIKEGVAEKK